MYLPLIVGELLFNESSSANSLFNIDLLLDILEKTKDSIIPSFGCFNKSKNSVRIMFLFQDKSSKVYEFNLYA